MMLHACVGQQAVELKALSWGVGADVADSGSPAPPLTNLTPIFARAAPGAQREAGFSHNSVPGPYAAQVRNADINCFP